MRIGYFTSIEGWGGSEICLQTLLRGVREQGHEPVLFGIEGTRLTQETRRDGIECVIWKTRAAGTAFNSPVKDAAREDARPPEKPSPLEGERPCEPQTGHMTSALKTRLVRAIPVGVRLLLGNAREAMALRRLFRQHPVDIMHVSLNGYEMAGLACRWAGIPSLGWHCITPYQDPDATRRWLIRWTGRCYTRVGGTSKACLDAWRLWCGLPDAQCVWIWNGIDLARFGAGAPVARGKDDPFVILAAGRLHPMKGFDGLIRAFGLLNESRAELRIAGAGEEDRALCNLAASTPGGGRIAFLGHSENAERLYAAAHVFVLPSVSHESFGLVVAEAMATGLPVITSDYGPLPEINVHGETGLVVPARDDKALAAALRHVMEHPEEARRWGANGRKRAQECFSSGRMVSEFLRLYRQTINDRSVPAKNHALSGAAT